MNATKFLLSTAAAVTVAGAIGLAYAQTNTNNSAGTPGTTGSSQTQPATTGQTSANVPGTQSQQQNRAPGSMTTDSAGTNSGAMNAGATAPGSTGNANSDSTYNSTSGAAPAMRSPQTPTTKIGQAMAPDRQSQRQSGAPGGTTTDSSDSANTARTATMNSNTGSKMNDGTMAMTTDGSANVRRNNPSTTGGMATERNARPDRN